MKIAFLPIDNRPVCYTLPKLMADIDENIKLYLPDRNFLGSLKKYANVEKLFEWLEDLPEDIDAMVLTLDTIAYGGLISSRRCLKTFDEIKSGLGRLKKILKSKNCKIYAFSSIMRISNNNYNEEEKEYWADWGKKIFEYSYNTHKNGIEVNTDVPDEILNDYLLTRKRNFEINKIYLQWQKEGLFDTLIFSKDDCAEFGLNVKEAQELEKLGGYTKTGADEIPLTLLSRSISGKIKICPIYAEPKCRHLISNYEDISVENSVKSQIELAGCEVSTKEDADILLFVNNFKIKQGEIVMKVATENFCENFVVPEKSYMVADVRFANGADNCLVDELFKNNLTKGNFYGYSGWNTTANTLGSLICGAKIKFLARKYNLRAFKKLQLVRFLDDWAYQANVRQELSSVNIQELWAKMNPYETMIKEKLSISDVNVKYSYPWERLFEVEIEFN